MRDLYHLSITEGAREFSMPEKALTFTQLITALKNRKLIDADPEIEPFDEMPAKIPYHLLIPHRTNSNQRLTEQYNPVH